MRGEISVKSMHTNVRLNKMVAMRTFGYTLSYWVATQFSFGYRHFFIWVPSLDLCGSNTTRVGDSDLGKDTLAGRHTE